MRIWSLHPQYLDSKGLVALWREGLLAKAVLAGQTKGYRNHPQLARFIQSPASEAYISAYLQYIHAEAVRRGYRFDESKIGQRGLVEPLPVTDGQLAYEWSHLQMKLRSRAPDWLTSLKRVEQPLTHPIFRVVQGGIASWEVGAAPA